MSGKVTGDALPRVPGYTLLEEIGRGASSRVFRARQETIGRDVALKISFTGGERGHRRAARLEREARLSGALEHPGIVRPIDRGEGEGFSWYAMEFVEGRDLERLVVERGGPLPARQVLRIGIQVLDALAHAHARGVVHRDLKPANIILDRRGRARILDLGLARREADPGLTQEGSTLGTPSYMSPEQARSPERVDARSDLFSLAATLWFCLGGRPPFLGQTVGQVLTRVLYEAPAPLGDAAYVPDGLERVLLHALEKEPHRRYRSALAFQADLRALAEGRRPDLRPARRTSVRRWIAAGAAAAGVVLVVLVAILQPWRAGESNLPPEREDGAGATPQGFAFEKRLKALLPREGSALTSGECLARIEEARDILSGLAPEDQVRVERVLPALETAFGDALRREAEEEVRRALEELSHDHVSDAREAALERLPALLSRRVRERLANPALVERLRPEIERRVALFKEALAKESATRRRHMIQLLEALPNQVPFDNWSGGAEELARVIRRRVEAWASLDGLLDEDLEAVESRERQILARILRAPRERAGRMLVEIEEHMRRREYARARNKALALRSVSERQHATAAARAAEWEAEIRRREAAEIRAAETLLEELHRRKSEAVTAEEVEARLKRLDEGIARLPPAGEVSGMEPLRKEILEARRILAGAAALRRRVLLAAAGLASGEMAFVPRVRGRPPMARRRLQGVEGRDLLFAALPERPARRLPVDEVSVELLEEILRAAGEKPQKSVLALAAHLSGEDLLAESLLEESKEERDALTRRLLVWAREGADAALGAFPSEEGRRAARELGRARRLLERGRTREALDLLVRLNGRGEEAGFRSSVFWKRRRAEVRALLTRARVLVDRDRALEVLKPFLVGASAADRIEVRLPLGTAIPPEVLGVPESALREKGGILLRPASLHPAARPDEVAPLVLHLPEIPLKRLEIGLRLVFRGAAPPGFLGLSCGGVSFLAIDHLRDDSPFRGAPLHGLEKRLWVPARIGRARFWEGEIPQFLKGWARKSQGFVVPVGVPLEVLVILDRDRKKAQINVGGRQLTISPSGLALSGAEVKILGFPELRVERLGVVLVPDPPRWDR